jgi:hypothetical protein
MDERTHERYLRSVLVVSGLVFIFGIALLMRLWPAGFAWTPRQPEYEQMIFGVCVTLGIFLLLVPRGTQLVAATGAQMSDAPAPSGR